MTPQPSPVAPLTDRERRRDLYGEPAGRPDANDLYERILALLDISDRLVAGAEVLGK